MDCEALAEQICRAIYEAAKKAYLPILSDKIAGYIRAYEQELDAWGPALELLAVFDRVLGCGVMGRAYEDIAREVCEHYRRNGIDHNESFCKRVLGEDDA